MARNKFEKELQEKMGQREIAPSPQAWDRLDAMLTVGEAQKSTPQYNWLLIAASVVGFLLIGTVVYHSSKTALDAPLEQVVVTEDVVPQPSQTPEHIVLQTQTPEVIAQTEESPKTHNAAHSQKPKTPQKLTVQAYQQFPQNTAVAVKNTNHQSNTINQTPQLEPAPETQKLLAQAAAAPSAKPIKVDARKLLGEAESEVQQSFRSRMLHRVGEVAMAVSERNNE